MLPPQAASSHGMCHPPQHLFVSTVPVRASQRVRSSLPRDGRVLRHIRDSDAKNAVETAPVYVVILLMKLLFMFRTLLLPTKHSLRRFIVVTLSVDQSVSIILLLVGWGFGLSAYAPFGKMSKSAQCNRFALIL